MYYLLGFLYIHVTKILQISYYYTKEWKAIKYVNIALVEIVRRWQRRRGSGGGVAAF